MKDPLIAMGSLKKQIVNDYINQLELNAWDNEMQFPSSLVSSPPSLIKSPGEEITSRRATSLARG